MSIQESLWDHKLLPLVSTWDEILQEAEFVEASHQVKKEMRDKHQPKNNGSNSTFLSHNRNKHSGNNNHHQRQPSAPRGPSLNKREPSSAAPQPLFRPSMPPSEVPDVKLPSSPVTAHDDRDKTEVLSLDATVCRQAKETKD